MCMCMTQERTAISEIYISVHRGEDEENDRLADLTAVIYLG